MNSIYKFSAFLFLACILLLAGCFEERNNLWEGEFLEWSPPDKSTNLLSVTIDLEADETENRFISLQIQLAGPHQAQDITASFILDQENSDAVEGEHFEIHSGSSVTIPAGSSVSEKIDIEIFSGAVERGEELNFVLLITDDANIPPLDNYNEMNIFISKDSGFIEAMEVTLDRPGFVADPDMLDVVTGNVYSKNEANDDPTIQQVIDFGLWNSSSTELTMIIPTDSDRLGGWGSGRTIRDEWSEENKNDGVLFKFPVDAENIDLFESILFEEDIPDAYYEAEERMDELGLDPDDYGPGGHLQYMRTGELIFFKSFDRNIYAVAYVTEATGSGSGYMDLLLKRYVVGNDD